MSLLPILGLGAGAAVLGSIIRRAEVDARVAIGMGCRCRDPKTVTLGSGRVALGCGCRWPDQKTTSQVNQNDIHELYRPIR